MSPLHFSHLTYVADLLSSLRPQYCCRHPCEISVSVLTHNCIQTCDFDCWDICGVLQLQNCCFRMFILGVVSRVCVVGQLQMHLMEFCVTILYADYYSESQKQKGSYYGPCHSWHRLSIEFIAVQVLYFCVPRISMTSENGRGTLTIRDVKEADQGAYTCEAINAKGLVFGIPDGVLTLSSNPNPGTNTSL